MKLFHALEPKRASVWWGFLYASALMLSTLYGYFRMVSLPWFIVQGAYVAIIGLGTLWVMLYGELSRIGPSFKMMILQMSPLIFSLIWSMMVWAFNGDTTAVMKRGLGFLGYQLLLMAMVHVAGMMFGPDMVQYTLFGYITGNFMILLDVIRRFGVGSFLNSFVYFLTHLDVKGAMAELEVQDLTFAFGAIMIYLFMYSKDKRKKWFILCSLIFFTLGWKRAAFLGVMMGCAYIYIMQKWEENAQMKMSLVLGATLVLIGFGYVVIIREGLLFDLVDMFGLNMMGRDKIYKMVEDLYEINPIFMGIGYGKVSTITEVRYARAVRGLHSDILRIYIELGFPGFFIWVGLTFALTYYFMAKWFSYKTATSYMAVALYLYLTYLTDNTASSYHTQVAWHLVPLAVYLEQVEANVVSTTARGREKMTMWKNRVSLKTKYPSLKEKMAAAKAQKEAPQRSIVLDKKKDVLNNLKKL